MDIGEKLRLLRIRRGLTQEDMADRCELSKGFISQVERNLASPSIATLTDMLECLGSSLSQFFSEDKDEKTVFTPQDMFVKEDEQLCGSITWLVPDAQKNTMEPILVDLGEDGRTYELLPHQGEEFGYVLEGRIAIVLGNQYYICKKGEAFYYSAGKPHSIVNKGRGKAKFLWISTPPNF